jgi:spermidine/putrescine transport system ATP-binding protein
MTPAVELRHASKSFGAVHALRDVSLAIRKGEFLSLLGPSGCGKSTTLNLIGGFEDATAGEVLIDGRTVTGTPPYLRPVNTVFQSYALFPHMSVAENVAFGLRMKGTPKPERQRAVADMLRMVSLDGFADRRPAQLSGGQRQRVALARALVNHPAVLLLDEPLGALDLKLRKQMQTELTRLQRQVGITFVYVTHDQEEAMAMSDRIAVMDRGRLLQLGTPDEILDDPQSAFVMEFFGSANVLPGRVEAVSGGLARTGAGLGRAMDGVAPGGAAQLLVRPEKLRLGAAGLPATVLRIARMGFVLHHDIRLDSGQDLLAYRLPGDPAPPLAEGQTIHVSWEAADARVFPVA